MEQIYKDDIKCNVRTKTGRACKNWAAYKTTNTADIQYVCGIHSRTGSREELLDKTKVALNAKFSAHALTCEHVNNPPIIKCIRMFAYTRVNLEDTFINVFPNRDHGSRKDGRGFPGLSPMNLGPVIHNEPMLSANILSANNTQANIMSADNTQVNITVHLFEDNTQAAIPQAAIPQAAIPQAAISYATCIENYHQFSKVYAPMDVADVNSLPNSKYYAARYAGFADPIGRRHRFTNPASVKLIKEMNLLYGRNKGAALYALHIDANAQPRKYNYVESRWFYCRAYEKLVTPHAEFAQVHDLANKHNIIICGYDGAQMSSAGLTRIQLRDNALAQYMNESQPFGHELALYCMLVLRSRNDYPWNIYAHMHPEIYEGIPDLG